MCSVAEIAAMVCRYYDALFLLHTPLLPEEFSSHSKVALERGEWTTDHNYSLPPVEHIKSENATSNKASSGSQAPMTSVSSLAGIVKTCG